MEFQSPATITFGSFYNSVYFLAFSILSSTQVSVSHRLRERAVVPQYRTTRGKMSNSSQSGQFRSLIPYTTDVAVTHSELWDVSDIHRNINTLRNKINLYYI